MTDYTLWEVILNGDSPPPTRSVDGVETPYPPTTVEEKLARKNELKARGDGLKVADGNVDYESQKIPTKKGRNLDSQLCDKSKTGLGYDSQGFNSQVLETQVNDKYNTCKGYHKVPHPYTGNFMPYKHDLVFADEHVVSESVISLPDIAKSKVKTSETKLKNVALSVNTARPINTAYPRSTVNGARPASNAFNKAYSHVRRPFNKFTTNKNSTYNQKVNTVKGNVTTVGSKAVVRNKKGNEANSIKASTCWIWRPKQKVLDHVSRHNDASMNFKRFDYIDAHGRSKHMTGNMSYLFEYEEIDGGYVSFGGDLKGGKITDTECVVLSPNFKLLDESQFLLRVPRQNNMYSVDLRNVAPSGDKFDGKADEGFFVGYSTHSKAFRVFNTKTKIVEENLHITFLENKPNIAGIGPNWMFDIDGLTLSMNYQPVFTGNHTNGNAGPKSSKDEVADNAGKKSTEVPRKENGVQDPTKQGNKNDQQKDVRDQKEALRNQFEQESERLLSQGDAANTNSTNRLITVSSPVNAVSSSFTTVDPGRERAQRNDAAGSTYVYLGGSILVNAATLPNVDLPIDPLMPDLEDTADTGIFDDVYDDREVGAEADTNNLELSTVISPIPTIRVHKDHPKEHNIRDLNLATQTRRMINFFEENAMVSYINKQRKNHKDYQNCLFACFLSQQEPKKVIKALTDSSWIEAMQEELLKFKIQKVWTLVDLLNGKRAIGTKWVFRNKKDKRGSIVRNKARLVAQGYTQEKDINYDEVFAPVARIEAIRLQGKQKDDEIFIRQDKYVADILKKFDFSSVKTASTLMEPNKALINHEKAMDMDVYLYRLMIGSFMYLSASRPDIMFVVCACARFQVTPKVSHLHAVKRIFRYLKDIHSHLTLPSNTSCIKQFWDSAKVKAVNKDVQIRALIDGKKIIVTEASIRRNLQLQDAEGTACLPNDTILEDMARMSTMASTIICLAKNIKFNFSKYILDNMVKNLEARVKFFMFSRFVQVFVNHQLERGKGFFGIITPLFETMMVQAQEEVDEGSEVPIDTHHTPIITQQSSSQPKKKKKSRRIRRKETEGRINEEDLFGVNDLDGDEVIVDVTAGENVEQSIKVAEKEVSTVDPVTTASEVVNTAEDVEVTTTATTPQISKDELTLAQTLINSKAAKPKARWVIVQEPSEFRTTSSSQPSQLPQAKDKGKGIIVEPEKPLKKKDQDEEVARKLEAKMKAEMEEEERIAREKDKANMDMIEQWDETDADMELAQKLQTKEQEQLTDAEKARLFIELLGKRRKFFARKREIKKRTRPLTKAQKRNLMCSYLKKMDGWKPKSLKKKSFDEIQKLFDSVMKKVNIFVDMNTEIVEERSKKTQKEVTRGSSKRGRYELEQKSAKRQKLKKKDDSADLKRCLEIVPEDDDDVTIEATNLSSRSPTIVDYNIYKQGKKSYFKIIRADGNSQSYLTFGKMFKNFNIEYLEFLWSIVKEIFKKTNPVDDMDNLLF
uniref:Ribonuclease H-like domain, reverse transcriptase, RNA-dependent DNA polymerase n=1 Tax=Tanacetum cinerariifolium TaxID=118510 RepID=A0A6L2N2A3_TANCI|nr:ribonuclease H-like domain, reverse transcriptase, RNA-dependent DNA polymerase [Tanacetum cinerariifolium]